MSSCSVQRCSPHSVVISMCASSSDSCTWPWIWERVYIPSYSCHVSRRAASTAEEDGGDACMVVFSCLSSSVVLCLHLHVSTVTVTFTWITAGKRQPREMLPLIILLQLMLRSTTSIPQGSVTAHLNLSITKQMENNLTLWKLDPRGEKRSSRTKSMCFSPFAESCTSFLCCDFL